MTIPEILGALAAALGTYTATHLATKKKLDVAVGTTKPGDGSLRDLVMKIDGKLDATADRFDRVDSRLDAIERRVFTPPTFPAIQAARLAAVEKK
jgi:hypothetical protein